MDCKCERIWRKAQPVLMIRKTTSVKELPEVLGSAYSRLMTELDAAGEVPTDAPFVAYYNMDTENMEIDIGFPVSKRLANNEDIYADELPPGHYVQSLFTGPYEELNTFYEIVMKWIEENGYTPSGAFYEFYLNSPHEVPVEDLQTRILIPILD